MYHIQHQPQSNGNYLNKSTYKINRTSLTIQSTESHIDSAIPQRPLLNGHSVFPDARSALMVSPHKFHTRQGWEDYFFPFLNSNDSINDKSLATKTYSRQLSHLKVSTGDRDMPGSVGARKTPSPKKINSIVLVPLPKGQIVFAVVDLL